jgi:antitoxin component of RelBE/YafQ-DinJ toxin-antitoxin module
MIKSKDILIRIDEETKNKAISKAKSIGLSLSSWVRTLIIKDLNS